MPGSLECRSSARCLGCWNVLPDGSCRLEGLLDDESLSADPAAIPSHGGARQLALASA